MKEGKPGPVEVGDERRFLSTLQGEDGQGVLVRRYTDQMVTVVALQAEGQNETDEDDGMEPLWQVRAADGTLFAAWESELIYGGSNVFVRPDGEYEDNPEWKVA